MTDTPQYGEQPANPADYLPPMHSIGFDDAEEFVQFLRDAREALRKRPLADEQVACGWGDHAIRFMDEIAIFIHVIDRDELAREDPEVRDNLLYGARVENMLFAKCYSVIVEDGEYGNVHRSVLWPITPRLFDAGRQHGWHIGSMPQWARDSMESAYLAYTDHIARNQP